MVWSHRGPLILAVLACGSLAHAEPADDIVARPLVLERGLYDVAMTFEAELSQVATHALSLTPDLYIGITPKLTFGITHTNLQFDRLQAGGTFCLIKSPTACQTSIRGGAVDVRYRVIADPHFQLAPRVRVETRDVDPFKPAVSFGALGKWQRGRHAIVFDPYLQLGLYNRDQGNRAQLWLPVSWIVQPACRWAIDLRTGIDGELVNWRDGWHIPVGLGVRARATSHFDVYVAFGFPSLLGPQPTPKRRAGFLMLEWRS